MSCDSKMQAYLITQSNIFNNVITSPDQIKKIDADITRKLNIFGF